MKIPPTPNSTPATRLVPRRRGERLGRLKGEEYEEDGRADARDRGCDTAL